MRVVAVPTAADRVRAVFGPYQALLAELLSQYTPDEITVTGQDFVDRARLSPAPVPLPATFARSRH